MIRRASWSYMKLQEQHRDRLLPPKQSSTGKAAG
jgi:hypothetical protein